MSDRVEDLERQVTALQAAVNGLTEELVETKERVRHLEDTYNVAVGDTPTETARQTQSDAHTEVVSHTESVSGSVDAAGAADDPDAADAANEPDHDPDTDLLVAGDDPTPTEPATSDDAAETGDTGDTGDDEHESTDSSSTDIIIA